VGRPSNPKLTAALRAIQAAARRAAVARRLTADAETSLLQSIVDATVRLFDAEAASIALFETNPDRLEFRVAAGPQGAGALGLSVKPSQGIAGYVFSTGQALALSDVGTDPRFDSATAQRTGYVPRSIAAVPLIDEATTVGVLQVLDKRRSPTFSARDMELLAVFAAQAAAAIGAAKIRRDLESLLRQVFRDLEPELDDQGVEALVSTAVRGLDRDEEQPFWRVVEQVHRLRGLGDRELALLATILEAIGEHAASTRVRRKVLGRAVASSGDGDVSLP
jgi:GAF domain-containing protein